MKILRRNLSLMLAVRYLNPLRTMFSVITLICLGGVALGVMVLIVVLSVMSGLQTTMEERVLAFTPHYSVVLTDGFGRSAISDQECNWAETIDKLQEVPGVVSVYPQLENDGFAQTAHGRLTVHFNAIQPHNYAQWLPLKEMLKEKDEWLAGEDERLKAGEQDFGFGEGLNQECIVSATTATSLGLNVGDTVHLTPVGSLDEVASIYAMIQSPLQTQENKEFMEGLSVLFEGAAEANGGIIVAPEKLEKILSIIQEFDQKKLRDSEKEACDTLYMLAADHLGNVPFSEEEQKTWKDTAAGLAALDRDKEDGKAVKSINEMVMPVDLKVIGIYQAPENMPGPNIYLPLTIAQDVMGYSATATESADDEASGECEPGRSGQIMGICVRVENPNNPGDVEMKILQALPDMSTPSQTHPMGMGWHISPWTKSFEQWYKLIANERIMMSFVLSIISLIASFCIMAVMFTMSMQRKREIAVLQALGATPGKIMGIFAWQGVIIGFVGAILGVVLALLVLYFRLEIQAALASIGMDPFPMQAHGIELPAEYDPAMFARQAIQAFVMVTIASIIPAFIVSRQDPAKALRAN
ncbi:MAG: ABC transporter permease [Akkermansia sp.]|nr:ABC transporter permease [Akkermansia sp.]